MTRRQFFRAMVGAVVGAKALPAVLAEAAPMLAGVPILEEAYYFFSPDAVYLISAEAADPLFGVVPLRAGERFPQARRPGPSIFRRRRADRELPRPRNVLRELFHGERAA